MWGGVIAKKKKKKELRKIRGDGNPTARSEQSAATCLGLFCVINQSSFASGCF